ncbi:5-formyltetrahydrofolate cyclo-ligase [Lactobacillus hominis]|uniref:5-formyltetrahydrofolate cyclo-ligase n=1 Tax=Lactobacillus hominis DSM 23910 = CRBIP 24.179 TaxID=1423758 RepID=I7JUW8_9LACO|nr:5-formyltetrahydrofolate cyclo-ligase [Lactobacillus hominis]KRM85667.1 5-formyltetrahydrofolate cyclo-ligase [Lactobacillus hominis DSM 23910 = CRBIP 24.179]MCT3347284.1 5-formyltetrahydrofolate cyclo-ligase [Lactobacillus hominis]CCI81811.1 Possible 5-formyltetrahydrofolate cyclo-ligase [Lactobacillus hominis DSM 23910 = CRBIP 24.179]
MNKIEFRKKQHQILKEFSLTNKKTRQDLQLTDKFLNSASFKNAQKIGITISMPEEVNTSQIILKMQKLGKEVYIPRCLPKRKMEFTRFIDSSQLTKTKFGTSEIWTSDAVVDNNLDLLVVPLLAFDLQTSQRLGFGGGYYDRFLEKFTGNTISLLNEKQTYSHAQWNIEDHDIPIREYILAD